MMRYLLRMDPAMRVTFKGPDGKPLGEWRHPWPKAPTYSYRTVLRNEIVFDVGDKRPWETARAHSHALWEALDREGVDHLRGLSGGYGTHTHIFFDSPLSNREREYIVDYYSQVANEILGGTGFEEPFTDTSVSKARNGKRVIREFGSFKEGRCKTLIEGQIPRGKTKAYIGPVTVPITLPVNSGCAPLRAFRIRKQTGQRCPVADDCWTAVNEGGCKECPMRQ